MPRGSEKRQNFFQCPKDVPVREFVNDTHHKHPWMQASVACLVTSERYGYLQVLLCLPHKVVLREKADLLRVPVQGRLLPFTKEGTIDPISGAREVLFKKAGLSFRLEDFEYLGYGYSDRYVRGGGRMKNGKFLHFVHARLPVGKVVPPQTQYAYKLEWHRADLSLLSVMEAGMRPRKRWAVLQAIGILAAAHNTVHTPKLQMIAGTRTQ